MHTQSNLFRDAAHALDAAREASRNIHECLHDGAPGMHAFWSRRYDEAARFLTQRTHRTTTTPDGTVSTFQNPDGWAYTATVAEGRSEGAQWFSESALASRDVAARRGAFALVALVTTGVAPHPDDLRTL